MKIDFLKAGTGDCILINHKNQNIIIDGGNDSQYLIDEYKKIIERGEFINLLIITHHDDDHIKGIIDLLNYIEKTAETFTEHPIKKVIFNSPKKIKLNNTGSDYLSYQQAHEVEEKLFKIKKLEWELVDESSDTIIFEEFSLDILSPTKHDLEAYSSHKGAYLTSDNRCDWNSSFSILEQYIDDKSQDISLPNKTSIVINLNYEDKKVLLTGDVTPDRFQVILEDLFKKNNSSKIKFEYIKLPHHGSYRSLNKEILKNIDCEKFIISTNSKKHYLPNKRAILKIIKFLELNTSKKINFYFNYNEAIKALNIEKEAIIKYNFQLNPNNSNTGYGISL